MKQMQLLVTLLILAVSTNAQLGIKKDYLKRPNIGVHYTMTDFSTANLIRTTSLNNVMLNKLWTKPRKMTPGMSLTYSQGLTNHIDIQGRIAGSFLDLPLVGGTPFGTDNFFVESDVSFQLKMLSDQYWVTPYLNVGIGGSVYKGVYYGAFLPVGGGVQVNLYDETFIHINSQYRIQVSGSNNYHFFHSIGLAGNIAKNKPAISPKPITVEIPKDSDGDGILDKDDACVYQAGVAKYKGCPVPDTDGDGITDENDKCPNEKGIAKYNGCPIPDTDNDGMNDDEDKCPTVAGVAKYNGCPIPDTDSDGVNDEEDKCPTVAGEAANQGCPAIADAVIKKLEFAAKNILFETSSAKLKATSNKSLNEVAKILTDNADLMLDIEGHTDNSGVAEKNKTLSESRANAVLTYLKTKGIAENRMTATGFGQEQPVADNKTPAGRTKNRRVELKLRSY